MDVFQIALGRGCPIYHDCILPLTLQRQLFHRVQSILPFLYLIDNFFPSRHRYPLQYPPDNLIRMEGIHPRAHREDLFRADHRVDPDFLRGMTHPFQDLPLLFPVGVGDLDLEHEPVHLGLGQGIGPFLLDGVLGGQDQEGLASG